jgi:hypothetical protein
MGSGVMIYIPNLIKIGSAIQKLRRRRINRQHGYHKSLLKCFENKESRLKKEGDKKEQEWSRKKFR